MNSFKTSLVSTTNYPLQAAAAGYNEPGLLNSWAEGRKRHAKLCYSALKLASF